MRQKVSTGGRIVIFSHVRLGNVNRSVVERENEWEKEHGSLFILLRLMIF